MAGDKEIGRKQDCQPENPYGARPGGGISLHYPPNAYRKPTQQWPGIVLNPREMIESRGIKVDDD